MSQLGMNEEFGPDYLLDLERWPLAQLRVKREACAEFEMELSYTRRLVQARVDLIVAESERRHFGLASPSPDALVEQLPHILGDRVRQAGPGRLPSLLAPSSGTQSDLAVRVEELLPSERLGSLSEMGSGELTTILESLSGLERGISSRRRELHDIIDRLQEELVRRYRTGEATVDALLGGERQG